MTGRTRTSLKRVLGVAVAAALTVPMIAVIDGAFSGEAATYVSGVDVSNWDHSGGTAISWTNVRRSGRAFAIVKATESTTYRNPYFATDFPAAKAAGLVVGAYHFARPSLPLSTASDQARYYIATVQKSGSFRSAGTFAPILDLEVTGGLSRANVIAWAKTFLATAQKLSGRQPIVYTYDSYVRDFLGNTTAFSTYPLWYARYTSVTPTSSMLPGGWRQWTMWQFTSTATTPGIVGTGDVSLFNGSATTLARFADGRLTGIEPPAAPTALVATPGVGTAALTWTPPTSVGGSPVLDYRVSIDGGTPTVTPGASFTAVGLAAGDHTVAVSAENLAGSSVPLTGSFTIDPYDPATVVPAAAVRLSVSAPTTASASTSSLVQVALVRSDNGQAASGAQVRLTLAPEMGPVTTNVLLTTAGDGRATVYIRPPVDATITAAFVGTPWYGKSTVARGIRVHPVLGAWLKPSTIKRRATTVMVGSTTPLLAGSTVYRQRYSSGRWITVTSRKVSATGSFSFSITPTTPGRRPMRFLLPATTHYLLSVSRTVVLTVT